jgi:predicted RNA-binding Zn-ribbon protein involved in translation (DUF1610 family)
MENAIEVCSGCGKLPRSVDTLSGHFVCTRCGNRTTIQVTATEYEKVVSGLDASFHARMLTQKLASVKSEPIVVRRAAKKSPKKKGKTTKKKR